MMDARNEYTESLEIKGKVKLQVNLNKIILTDIY